MKILLEKINQLFINLGFVTVKINDQSFLKYDEAYYKVSYVESLDSIVIETAESLEEVRKNILEDSDFYSLSLGEKGILETIKEDLLKYYIK